MEFEGETRRNKSQADDIICRHLYKAIFWGDLEDTKRILDKNPDAVIATLDANGRTALHIAVAGKNIRIIEELIKRMLDMGQSLEIKDKSGRTPLIYAAAVGTVRIAKCLVKSFPRWVSIEDNRRFIPVVEASEYEKGDLVRYLYSETPVECLDPDVDYLNSTTLFINCIRDELFDIALRLLKRYPQLAYSEDIQSRKALEILAQKPSAFPNGNRLGYWQWLKCSCIQIGRPRSSTDTNIDIERPQEGPSDQRGKTTGGFHLFQDICWTGLKFKFRCITNMYKLQLKHSQAIELLRCICQETLACDESEFKKRGIPDALFSAVAHGVDEIVKEMIKQNPRIIYCRDEENVDIVSYAVLKRQEKVLNLVYKIRGKSMLPAAPFSSRNNNLLHMAAFLAPTSVLHQVPGAALQAQRELQWFEEMKKLVRPSERKMENNDKKTPETLFTEQHKDLFKEGEEWMKKTAESCTVVAALIATVVFSAAFTIPGEYNDKGVPRYIHDNSFIVFLVSDALSLFTSTTSILLFLGILTSQYQEQDFLVSLPKKLILGLSMLCISMATMMVAFAAAVSIILKEKKGWVAVPVILLSSLPVVIFAGTQFPLLLHVFCSTYGPGLLKPRKWKLF